MIFYESVHRIEKTLEDLVIVFGASRPAFLGRELSKLYEQCVHAQLAQLRDQIAKETIPNKGEFVLVVGGSTATEASSIDIDRLLVELADKLPGKEVAKILSRATGEKRNALYKRLLELSNEKGPQ